MKSDLTDCPCGRSKNAALSVKYESIRSLLVAIYTNKCLMKRIKAHNRNSSGNFISGIHGGNLFRESVQKSMKDDTHFTFHLAFAGDVLTYFGVFATILMILDLSPELMHKKEFVFIPFCFV